MSRKAITKGVLSTKCAFGVHNSGSKGLVDVVEECDDVPRREVDDGEFEVGAGECSCGDRAG